MRPDLGEFIFRKHPGKSFGVEPTDLLISPSLLGSETTFETPVSNKVLCGTLASNVSPLRMLVDLTNSERYLAVRGTDNIITGDSGERFNLLEGNTLDASQIADAAERKSLTKLRTQRFLSDCARVKPAVNNGDMNWWDLSDFGQNLEDEGVEEITSAELISCFGSVVHSNNSFTHASVVEWCQKLYFALIDCSLGPLDFHRVIETHRGCVVGWTVDRRVVSTNEKKHLSFGGKISTY